MSTLLQLIVSVLSGYERKVKIVVSAQMLVLHNIYIPRSWLIFIRLATVAGIGQKNVIISQYYAGYPEYEIIYLYTL